MWDVRKLQLLSEVHDRGTLAAVAVALHQSPSSVSQQLAQLERDVGIELLQKSGRGVQLTPQAEVLVAHSRAIFDRLELAESQVLASLREPIGMVRLAIFQSAALALVPRTLSILAERDPGLRVTVTQREPETAMHETVTRTFDLVIAEQYPDHVAPWAGLARQPLVRDSIQLAVPSGWTHIKSLADAADAPWAAESHGAASRHYAEQVCRRAGFDPDIRFETDDLQVHIALIASGNAVALMPELMWQADRNPAIRLIDLPRRPRRTVFSATRPSAAARPSVVTVRTALRQAAREFAVRGATLQTEA